ncbi:MAG TPA: restriction endonuclease subunit R [Naasia sp.]|jgi:hypothetical protein
MTAPRTLPDGWILAASSFNWTPEIVEARRPAAAIVAGIVAAGVASTLELEAGQVLRSYPAPNEREVDALRGSITESGGSIAILGASLDDFVSPTMRRSEEERLAFLAPQLRAASRLGARGVRLPLGQAGPSLVARLQPLLHDLDLILFEEIQGQQHPESPSVAPALQAIADLADPRVRVLVDISMLMPALPPSYLARLAASGVPAGLLARLAADWRSPDTAGAVGALLRSGGVPPAVHTLYMNLLIRFGRSSAEDLRGLLPLVGGFHLKFWDLDDEDGRVTGPLRDLGRLLAGSGFRGTLTSEWGGHEWLDDDPTDITQRHLALAADALAEGAAA